MDLERHYSLQGRHLDNLVMTDANDSFSFYSDAPHMCRSQ